MGKVRMTVQGAQKLREELSELKKHQRPKLIQALAEARAHGDLRENAEFHAAKEQQGFLEGRIAEIETSLAMADVIDTRQVHAQGKVVFGATVDLVNTDTAQEDTYQIVGELEADINRGLISVSSPTARALIGKEEGDEVTVQAPAGEVHYEILAVRYV